MSDSSVHGIAEQTDAVVLDQLATRNNGEVVAMNE
jgi:hypothetical protein